MQISLNLNISPYNLINPLISISFFFFAKKFFKTHAVRMFLFSDGFNPDMDLY